MPSLAKIPLLVRCGDRRSAIFFVGGYGTAVELYLPGSDGFVTQQGIPVRRFVPGSGCGQRF
jgi:hypothetical protein